MKIYNITRLLAAAGLITGGLTTYAAEWSNNSIGIRVGSTFAEPGIPGSSIGKTILNFTHVSGDKLGRNLVVGDVLQSSVKDPAVSGGGGAQEFYGLYRRTFSLTKLTGNAVSFGSIKDVNLVGRIDRQTKNITFAPRARKLFVGTSFEFDVPKGYVESGIYAYSESNHNGILGRDVNFKTTYALDTSWAIPFSAGVPATWKGTLAYTGAKGKDGFGNATKAETRLFSAVMFDVGTKTGLSMGLGYEIWRNKYGNNQVTTPGARQNVGLFLTEYQF